MRATWRVAAGWLVAITLSFLVMGFPNRFGLAGLAIAQEDPVLLRELAERLLAQQYPTGGPGADTETPRTQLLPGRLPDDPWFALPLPAGGRLVGSAVRPASGTGATRQRESISVVLDAPGTPQDVDDFFAQALLDLGWQAAPVGFPAGGGGFQATRSIRMLWFCQSTGVTADPNEAGPGVTVTISPRASGLNEVRLTSAGGGPPCYTPSMVAPPGLGLRQLSMTPNLPALTPPSDVQLEPRGFSGGVGGFASEAFATTARSVADLDDIFGNQLATSGWVRRAGLAEGPVAWSTWQVPGEDDDQLGMLLIVETPGENRRSFSLRVYSASSNTPGFGGPVRVQP